MRRLTQKKLKKLIFVEQRKKIDGNYYAKSCKKDIIAISNIKNKNQKIIFNKNQIK